MCCHGLDWQNCLKLFALTSMQFPIVSSNNVTKVGIGGDLEVGVCNTISKISSYMQYIISLSKANLCCLQCSFDGQAQAPASDFQVPLQLLRHSIELFICIIPIHNKVISYLIIVSRSCNSL